MMKNLIYFNTLSTISENGYACDLIGGVAIYLEHYVLLRH